MDGDMDEEGEKLLNLLQKDFPLSPRPYSKAAKTLGLTEEEVVSKLAELKEKGMIRKIGAVISPKKMGYVSMLAAADIPEGELEEAASIVNSYDGVTHNYERGTSPNLWFALIEPNESVLDNHLDEIEERLGREIVRMPMRKMYKIGVKLDIRS